MTNGIIESRGLTQRYGQTSVLKNIDLTVTPGETLGIIGPSGAGKSTLIRLLDLLETPSGGAISVLGQAVNNDADRLHLRRRMAFVHQKPLVFTTSVFNNVAQPLRWRGVGVAEARGRVMDALEMVGLADLADRHAKTLSGGETQRVALARALVVRPEVLFLDEPTANLDPNSTTKVENLIASIIKEQRLTVVMTTHDLAQGQRLADRLGVLVAGELLQLGQSHEIFMSPACRAVAEFIGLENILKGIVTGNNDGLLTATVDGYSIQAVGEYRVGETVDLFIRPENVVISTSDDHTSARNRFPGIITGLSLVGPLVRLEIDCGGFPLMAVITRQSAEDLGLSIGGRVTAGVKATTVHSARGACAPE
ncbi:ABC transporter related protein [Dehalogenimonas lykanthroporepellens BL-DC-9]|nr:ABC transporter related protein [Dehalogenimonas lykanthroporepellens BL-DC-9]